MLIHATYESKYTVTLDLAHTYIHVFFFRVTLHNTGLMYATPEESL